MTGRRKSSGASLNGEYSTLDVGAENGINLRLLHVGQLGSGHDACIAAKHIDASVRSNSCSSHTLTICGIESESGCEKGGGSKRGAGSPAFTDTSPTKETTCPAPRADSSSAHAVTEREQKDGYI
jgi:hypothetical protein